MTEDERHRKAVELGAQMRKIVEESWPEIFATLTERGKTLFVIDMLQAQLDAPGDVDALVRVGEAWWRTQQARASYLTNLDQGEAQAYTSAELRAVLDLGESAT